MTLFTRFLRYAGMFVLLWGASACSERQQVTDSEPGLAQQSTVRPMLSVYKSPTCGCCGDWIEHIEASGINTQVYHPTDLIVLLRTQRLCVRVYSSAECPFFRQCSTLDFSDEDLKAQSKFWPIKRRARAAKRRHRFV